MRSLLLVLLAAGAGCAPAVAPAAPAPETVVILVRHAEKASETADDPPLSARGRERAEALGRALAEAGVSAVIVSERIRTHQTVEPLLRARGLVPDTIPIRQGADAHARGVAAMIRERYRGKTVLVSGHSNTIPRVMTALGAGPLPDICDAAYANLYVMILQGNAPPRILRTTFGPADPPGAEACGGMQAR